MAASRVYQLRTTPQELDHWHACAAGRRETLADGIRGALAVRYGAAQTEAGATWLLIRISPPNGYTQHSDREQAFAALHAELPGEPLTLDDRGRVASGDGDLVALIRERP